MDQVTFVRPGVRWRGRAMALLVVVALFSLACPSGAETESNVRYIAPTPAGRADGSDWANAAGLKDLPELVADLQDGGEILVRAGSGAYRIDEPIILGDRQASAELRIRGVDPDGKGGTPLLVGERAAPYTPETAATGRPVFALDTGANHLTFEHLSFRNVGNGCFLVRGAVVDLTISDVSASNVRRFIENEDDDEANVVGLVVRDSSVRGFSKDAVRLRNDTHDVLIEDVGVDSEGQDGDSFAMGFHLTETVHDVVFRRVAALNARDTVSDYRNGDGFVAERRTYGLLFEDTKAIGNMDAGYDIKASNVRFVGAIARGNKRNFRIWGSDVAMSWSLGVHPIRRGGLGTQAQVWAGPAARFVIEDSRFQGGDSDTVVFDLEIAAAGVAKRTVVRRARGSRLSELAEDSAMTLNGEQLGT